MRICTYVANIMASQIKQILKEGPRREIISIKLAIAIATVNIEHSYSQAWPSRAFLSVVSLQAIPIPMTLLTWTATTVRLLTAWRTWVRSCHTSATCSSRGRALATTPSYLGPLLRMGWVPTFTTCVFNFCINLANAFLFDWYTLYSFLFSRFLCYIHHVASFIFSRVLCFVLI